MRQVLCFHMFTHMQHSHLDIVAAGAGAGVAAGFGAPMSGVLFAVETMLLNPSAAAGRRAASEPPAGPHKTAAGAADSEDDGGLQVWFTRFCSTRFVPYWL